MLNLDSSPFQSSPFNASQGDSSPRLFWQGRDPATPNRLVLKTENALYSGAREASPSPTRRSSIEKLQKASRVKNSNMFAREQKQEYDPTSTPVIERPLAKHIQGNAYNGAGLEGLRSEERNRPSSHKRAESKSNIPLFTPTKTSMSSIGNPANGRSPSKDQISPTKSSLASRSFNGKASYDPEHASWSEENSGDEKELPEGRVLHRHAKSVTFDAAPPQINEYEMTTPDLSSVGSVSRENSYDSEEDEEEDYNRGESEEREDSFDASLEDTDKTPVVGPEDWRHASPSNAHGVMGGRFDDPFEGPEGSPMPEAGPSSPDIKRPAGARTDSLNSNGDHRPLPPLPPMDNTSGSRNSVGLSEAAERASSSQRTLPSPPKAASFSKSDIQGLSGKKMTLEERLKLMMIQDEETKPKTAAEEQRERRMRRAGPRERSGHTPEREIQIHEDEDTLGDLGEYQLPPRISRESILRKVNGQEGFSRESDYTFNSSPIPSSPERPSPLDPDTPIPSTEDRPMGDNEDSIIIKPEPEEEVDLYSIHEMYQRTESGLDVHENVQEDESEYSDPTPTNHSPQLNAHKVNDFEASKESGLQQRIDLDKEEGRVSLPEFEGFSKKDDYGLGLQSYMTPSPPPLPEKDTAKAPLSFTQSLIEAREYLQRPTTPQDFSKSLPRPAYDGSEWGPEEDEYESGTPDSVLHHPMQPTPPRDSPAIPEKVATIKSASGSKLKTRPSATPSDLMAMREQRRQISGEIANIPPIPERHRNRPSLNLDRSLSEGEEDDDGVYRKTSFKKKSLTLDIGSDLALTLDKDFDRVIEDQKVAFNLSSSNPTHFNTTHRQVPGQASIIGDLSSLQFELSANITPRKQRGYLMRQNTKLVVASSDDKEDFRGTRSAGNSPVKKDRPQSWTVEPWNGQMRKKSVRDSRGHKKMPSGPMPPMPGHESNVTGLGILTEEEPALEQNVGDAGERGRLFVKVLGVKDLDLPLPKGMPPRTFEDNRLTVKGERSWFSLTLDNGVHCVTTAWLELAKNAPIGQEFELVVPNELEFQLTLNAKLEKPEPKRVVESPTKQKTKPSTFSRVFASPKKRKELELRQKEEEARIAEQKRIDAQAKRMTSQPTTWDLLSPLAAEDGSFGRSYVCLKDHETRCFGRPYVVDVSCFNEWATEDATAMSSMKSKRGNTHVKRRAPYKVGKLELQLLFVPRPKGATDEDMPKSMNSCIREMKEVEAARSREWEGHLSQQGGDCPVSCRLPPRLKGSSLLTILPHSTGVAAFSNFPATSSPPTTNPHANLALPSTSPMLPSSLMTVAHSLPRKPLARAAAAARVGLQRKRRVICLLKKVSASALLMERLSTSTRIRTPTKRAG